MKPSQLAVSAGKTAAAAPRAGALILIALVVLLPSTSLPAATDRAVEVSPSPRTLEMADASTPSAQSNAPREPETAKPHAADTPPAGLSVLDRIQDWLARANREYQTTVIPRLSVPTPESIAAEKRQAEEAKQAEDARKAAEQARVAEEARKAEEAKRAEEARKAEEAQRAEEAREAAEQARLAEQAGKAEEAKQAEDARKAADQARLAEEARKADEAKRAEEARKAAEQARVAEEARKAEEAKRAEEARKAAEQERLAEETRKAEEAKQAEDARKAAEQARFAEEARKAEEAKRTEEARKAEEQRQAADAQRKADEAKRLADEQAKADDARKKAESDRQHTAAVEAESDGEPSAEPMPPEAIPSPGTDAAQKLPPTTSGTTSGEESDSDLREETAQAPVKSQQAHAKHARRAATKRWISRMHRGRCPSAGRRITPPGYYTVQRGDTLWRISRRHYRAGARYRRIYRANRLRIRDPNLIYPCQTIFVPRRP